MPGAQAAKVTAFSWDDDNERHLRERHPDLDPADVDSVLDGAWVWLENKQGRAAILVLGVDRWGRKLAVPADPTGEPGVYRPRTAHQMTSWQVQTYDDALGAEQEGSNGEDESGGRERDTDDV